MADQQPPIVITLTLPTVEGGSEPPEERTGTIVVKRGDLAHMGQFTYHGMVIPYHTVVNDAITALDGLEAHPPADVTFDKPETPSPKASAKRKSKAKTKTSKKKADKPAATTSQSEPVVADKQPDPEPEEEVEDWLKPFKQQKVVNR